MITLSLCMIVKNEEDVLFRCLNSVRDAMDEIIIVDTGSTDRTKEIARQFTSQIYDFPWQEDFAAARNYSFSKAAMDYTMWLDADDVMDRENLRLLKQLKEELNTETDMVMMKYDVAFDENSRSTFSYYRERLFKTARHFLWVGEIHEVIPPSGIILHRDISIRHQKAHPTEAGRNLRIFEKMLRDGKTLDPRQTYYYGRELFHNGQTERAIDVLERFLSDHTGWLENQIGACKDLAACYAQAGNSEQSLQSLLRSFTYDIPRAELCCEIGNHFFNRQQYPMAVYWYEAATRCKKNSESGAFCLPDCYDYFPFLQLCVCYDRLGDSVTAAFYNEKAGLIKPEDKSYLYNKAYFEKLFSPQQ